MIVAGQGEAFKACFWLTCCFSEGVAGLLETFLWPRNDCFDVAAPEVTPIIFVKPCILTAEKCIGASWLKAGSQVLRFWRYTQTWCGSISGGCTAWALCASSPRCCVPGACSRLNSFAQWHSAALQFQPCSPLSHHCQTPGWDTYRLLGYSHCLYAFIYSACFGEAD